MRHLDLTLNGLRIIAQDRDHQTLPWRVDIFAEGKHAVREWDDADLAAVLAISIDSRLTEYNYNQLYEVAEDACAGLDQLFRPF